MSYNSIIKIVVSFTVLLIAGCKSESADLLYTTNDEEAKALYTSELQSIIEEKCISCHIYHLEGLNRYDSYDKTKAAISTIIQRVNAADNSIMPPADSAPLTTDEMDLFNEFLSVLNSKGTTNETDEPILPVQINWTAYKYPINREGVGGTFDDVEYSFNTDYRNIVDLLNNATITINTSSVNVSNNEPLRTGNVGMFFEYFTSEIIGTVISYSETEAIVEFEMNNITNEVSLSVSVSEDESTITLSGAIENMEVFNWQEGYNALEDVCGEFHEYVLWPDIDIEAIITINEI